MSQIIKNHKARQVEKALLLPSLVIVHVVVVMDSEMVTRFVYTDDIPEYINVKTNNRKGRKQST